MANIPTFGTKKKGVAYIERPSAYEILLNKEGRIAIIEVRARYFLPGGGIDDDETAEECVTRESLEEIGFEITGLHFLGETVDYFQSFKNQKYYCIPSSYFTADHFKIVQEPIETDHILHWMKPEEAAGSMARPGFTWAIQTFLKNH